MLLRLRTTGSKASHLLDLLIETRDRECEDSRDKIFGILSISFWMDNRKFPYMEADYRKTTTEVYTDFSIFFIKHHGSAFFLSLKKSPSKQPGIPSWAANWTFPWPNLNAVRGIDLWVRSRMSNSKDAGVDIL